MLRNNAIKFALAQYYALLSTPKECIKYLKFINLEFIRNFREKHKKDVDALEADIYNFQIFNGLYYPIPKENYKGIKKFSALQEFLILLFQKHGLAQHAYKWIGYIPNKIANAMIEEGSLW